LVTGLPVYCDPNETKEPLPVPGSPLDTGLSGVQQTVGERGLGDYQPNTEVAWPK